MEAKKINKSPGCFLFFIFWDFFGFSRRYAATDWSIPYNWIRFVSSILHAMQAILMQLCQGGIREHDIVCLWLQVLPRRDRCAKQACNNCW